MKIDKDSYLQLAMFLNEKIGLSLEGDKSYLLEMRLESILIKYDCVDFKNLVFKIQNTKNSELINEVCDALTTNESLFFRDMAPFIYLKNTLLPELIKKNAATKKIAIWCAACSKGQEPYSIAMLIDELFSSSYFDWEIKIIATDISDKALALAKEGLYSKFEAKRGLYRWHLDNYFSQEKNEWRIKDKIKKYVEFRKLNLVKNFSHMETFDIIFCRNVLIYFNVETKKNVMLNLAYHLIPNGHLFVGGAESMIGISDMFEGVKDTTAIYKKK